jgi:hypothetical protein
MSIFPKEARGLAARAFRTFDAWALSRPMQIGLVEDELLNVVDIDGVAGETFSVHAATAERANPPQEWACWLCAFLSRRIQKNHCQLVLDPNFPMPEAAALKAFTWITGVLVINFAVPALMLWRLIRLF